MLSRDWLAKTILNLRKPTMTQDELDRLEQTATTGRRLADEAAVIDRAISEAERFGIAACLRDIHLSAIFRPLKEMSEELSDAVTPMAIGVLHAMRQQRIEQLRRLPFPVAKECGSDGCCPNDADPLCS